MYIFLLRNLESYYIKQNKKNLRYGTIVVSEFDSSRMHTLFYVSYTNELCF